MIERFPSQRQSLVWLGVIVALAVLARVIYFFVVFWPIEDRFSEQGTDGYWRIAENMLTGRGYVLDDGRVNDHLPTALRPPLPALFFLPFIALFGPTSLPIIIGQWIVVGATVAAIYPVALWSVNDQRAALLSALSYAVYVPSYKLSIIANSETFFTFLLVISVLLWLKAMRTGRLRWFALAGVMIGLSTLSRPATLALPGLVVLSAGLLFRRQPGRWVRAAAATLLAFGLALSPWVIRNYLLFNSFIPGSTVGNFNLYHDFRYFLCQRSYMPCEAGLGWQADKTEAEVDRLFQAETGRLIRQYPLEFGLRFFDNFSRFWFDTTGQRFHDPEPVGSSLITRWTNAVLLIIAAIGWTVYRRRWTRAALPILSLLAYFTLFHMLVFAQVRYSQPTIPFLGIAVAYTLVLMMDQTLRRLRATDVGHDRPETALT